MPDDAQLDQTMSLSVAQAHDRLCDQLESGWGKGSPPRIEDLLAQVPVDQQPYLFAALLEVELECRPTPPLEGEYEARFLQFAHLIERARHDPIAMTASEHDVRRRLPPPPSIPGYEIHGLIGAGGMGVVYRARHIDLDRTVAIKTIRSGAWASREFLLRFHREARAVASLNHAGVVQLYAFGQVDDVPYYVMEFVEGGSLEKWLDARQMGPGQAALLTERLADITQHVHDREIVHRDLKPANILLTSTGNDDGVPIPKLADFGLAKRLDGTEPGLSNPDAIIGTASYMSPEQARGGNNDVGKPADIYALGAIMFELLTGRPPFRAATRELTVIQVLTEDPPRPTELVPELPLDLEAICLKCLEKDPVNRYASAGKLADDLRRFARGEPIDARPLSLHERDAIWARRIGYEIRNVLGQTSWSRTYSAVQNNIQRQVMLKLSAGRAGGQQHEALRRYATIVPAIAHPNILRLLDYVEKHDQAYLVLEHSDGSVFLSRLLREDRLEPDETARRPLAPNQAIQFGLMIALGLQEIHEQGVLHLGLHSDSIIVTQQLVAKIAGFELSRKHGAPISDDLSPPPGLMSAAFVAPELLANRADRVDRQADVYGLGAILYDMLTGQPPFVAPTEGALREQVLNEVPIPPSRIEPGVPAAVEAVCLCCLEKEPAKRYPTAGSVALELQRSLRPAISSSDSTVITDEPGVKPIDYRSMIFQLRVLSGPDQIGQCFAIGHEQVKIGRLPECGIFLNSNKVSRHHCEILWNEDAVRHELVNFSKNGSKINGKETNGNHRLLPGDLILLPEFVLKFEAVTE
jgi:eukaryotic-like serine/threonine-protein kinase